MATERLSMRKTREILRLKWDLGRSHREVAQSLGVSVGVVGSTVRRAQAAGLNWGAVFALTDDELEQRLYVPRLVAGAQRPRPDCAALDVERRKPGVTLALLHLEYLERHPDGYRYTQFCEIYRRWLKRRPTVVIHRAGEKCSPTIARSPTSSTRTGEFREGNVRRGARGLELHSLST
jgi:hypothetical protein